MSLESDTYTPCRRFCRAARRICSPGSSAMDEPALLRGTMRISSLQVEHSLAIHAKGGLTYTRLTLWNTAKSRSKGREE
jgi:hypothetical protein